MLFFRKEKKIGLALGGGAARGFAHLGVLKAFETYNIPIDYIAGTSSGSMVAGLYAAGVPIDTMIKEVPNLRWRDFAKLKFSRKSMASSLPLEKTVQRLAGDLTLRELKIPFSGLATDIMSGQGVILNDPELRLVDVIRASTSFPGIYDPFKMGDRYFVDGGASANVPSVVVREMGAHVVIAVDVIPNVKLDKMPHHIPVIIDRGLDLILHNVSKLTHLESDIVLEPVKEYVHSFQVKRGKELIEMGFNEVERRLSEIRELLA